MNAVTAAPIPCSSARLLPPQPRNLGYLTEPVIPPDRNTGDATKRVRAKSLGRLALHVLSACFLFGFSFFFFSHDLHSLPPGEHAAIHLGEGKRLQLPILSDISAARTRRKNYVGGLLAIRICAPPPRTTTPSQEGGMWRNTTAAWGGHAPKTT